MADRLQMDREPITAREAESRSMLQQLGKNASGPCEYERSEPLSTNGRADRQHNESSCHRVLGITASATGVSDIYDVTDGLHDLTGLPLRISIRHQGIMSSHVKHHATRTQDG